MATTWDSTNKSAGITLSGGNLVATITSGTSDVAATRPLTGPTYFEVAATTQSSTFAVGLCSRQFSMSGSVVIGANTASIGFYQDGTVKLNAANLTTIQTFTQGDVVRVAVDPANRLIWFNVNNGNWNNDVSANPTTGVNGIDFSSMVFDRLLPAFGGATVVPNQSGTAVFSSGFSYGAPTGFVSIDTVASNGVASVLPTQNEGPVRADQNNTFTQKATAFGGGYGPGGENYVSGTVTQNGAPAAKQIRIYDHGSGEYLGTVTSSSINGTYSIKAMGRKSVFVIAFGDPTQNALVYDLVVPT
jgi:hypothetical protein